MNGYHETARAVFDEIREMFPHLAMRESEIRDGEPDLEIPEQAGLGFDMSLYLYGDVLNICAGEFWGEWFPCTDSKVVSLYHEAATGLLSGRFRIVEHSRNGRLVKAYLQRPTATGWENISRYYRGFSLPWLRTEQRILQNAAAA